MEEEEALVRPAELLELVSGLHDKGAEDAVHAGELRRSANALYFAKAIMRTLRREQRAGGYSAMSQLVRWEIPKSDLVPLLLQYRRDKELCRALLKILVALTLPVTRAFQGVQDHVEKLQNCKEVLVRTPDVLAVLMSYLAEPLAREERTKEDASIIDAVLNLIHNLLHIRCPTKPHLEDEMVQLLFRENALDALVVIAQSVDAEANRQWALLLTNTLFLLVDGIVPEEVSFAHHSRRALREGNTSVAKALESESTSRLKSLRAKEKQRVQLERFRLSGPRQGGTLMTKEADGSRSVVRASELLVPMRTAPKVKPRQRVAPPWDRVDRVAAPETLERLHVYAEALLTSNVFSLLMHEAASSIANADVDLSFVPSFQADVNRYIRLIAWFCRFDYVRQVQAMRLRENPSDVRREHSILDAVPANANNQTFTLEHIEVVLNGTTVDFLFQRAEHSLAQKPPSFRDVHIIFRALGEFLNTCGYILCNGTMQLRYEAKKTLYRIFLDRRKFLDQLPQLLARVVLSKMPRHYLLSLINTVDLTFIILEKIEEIDRGLVVLKKRRQRGGGSTTKRGDENEPDDDTPVPVDDVPFNDFEELQTQDFRLSDYVRRFQHNKVVEICTVLLEDYASNTDELNRSIWRLFERIRTGAGDPNNALPAIFCQVRLLSIFARLLEQRQREGGAMRATLADLADFGEHIVTELMRLTAGGSNAHIFAALLFWRSLRENQDFEDLNMRMALEDAEEQERRARAGAGHEDGDEEQGADRAAVVDLEDDGPVLYDDEDILLDPEAIAQSLREDEERRREAQRRRESRAPKKPKTAYQHYCADERAKEANAGVKPAALKAACKAQWQGAAEEVKAQYAERARADKERYAREMELYVPSDHEDGEFDEASTAKPKSTSSAQARRLESQALLDRLAGDDSSSEDVPIGRIYAHRLQLEASAAAAKRKQKRKQASRKREPEPAEEGSSSSEQSDAPAHTDAAAKSDADKRAKTEEGGRAWTAAEDASLRANYRELHERQPAELPRLLYVLTDWSRPVTHAQIAQRLSTLGLIDARRFAVLMRSLQ